MKRIITVSLLIIMGVVLLALLLPSPSQSNAPRFVPAPAGFKGGAYTEMDYNFLLPSPFEGGLVWISVFNKRVSHSYLYDIEHKKVLGELINGWPEFGNRDQSKVLLMGNPGSFKEKLFQLVGRITGGKLTLSTRNIEESFEVFDRKKNHAEPVGRMYQFAGAGSRWYPSPTYRYGFTRPTANSGSEVFLCDLDKSQMTKITIRGIPVGWWNETAILYKSNDRDFALYDVVREKTSVLLKADAIKEFLKQNKFSTDLSRDDVKPFPMWDGRQYQFYFTDTYKRWEATNSFLAKIERPSGSLKLIDADFKFEWSDSFDNNGRYYLFGGREFSDGDKVSGVYLRDLQTGETRTLVEDCGIDQHSIPQWYGNGVIYSRSNMLWRIGLSETNATRLFPPPDK